MIRFQEKCFPIFTLNAIIKTEETQIVGPYLFESIRTTCTCNENPLTPHFYIVKLGFTGVFILAHLSRRLKGELIYYPCSGVCRRYHRCRCRRRRSPFSNMNISEASRPIAIKFYLKYYWGGGKAAWGFGADHFRTLVSMATYSSHRVIKTAASRFLKSF